MIRCTDCGYDNVDGAKFCGRCASPLRAQRQCQVCGSASPLGSRYCNQCGAALPSALVDDGGRVTPEERGADSFESEIPVHLMPPMPTYPFIEADVYLPAGNGQERYGVLASALDADAVGAHLPAAPVPQSAVADTEATGEAEPEGECGLSLADCMADRGSGPPLAMQAAVGHAVDAENAPVMLAEAVRVPASAVRIRQGRTAWLAAWSETSSGR